MSNQQTTTIKVNAGIKDTAHNFAKERGMKLGAMYDIAVKEYMGRNGFIWPMLQSKKKVKLKFKK